MLADLALFYKNVFELSSDERPPNDVIEDDNLLDAYLKDLERQRAEK